MDKFQLISSYPGRRIGDIALYDPKVNQLNFVWQKDSMPIPREFQPDLTPGWFKKVNHLFTTKDCVDIFEGDSWWYVVNDSLERGARQTNTLVYLGNRTSETTKFSTREAAEAFIRENTRRTPVFKTSEGIDMFEGEDYFCVNTSNWAHVWKNTAKKHTRPALNVKTFKLKKDADEFLFRNKPCLSINEVAQVYSTANQFNSYKGKFSSQGEALRRIVNSKSLPTVTC